MHKLKLTAHIKKQIKQHCLTLPNSEACGLLIQRPNQIGLLVYPCKNLSKHRSKFTINPIDYVKGTELGDIIGIYHSHINNQTQFTQYDALNADKHDLIYVLYNVNYDQFTIYYPNQVPILYVGIPFNYGQHDCFSLIRKFYQTELNINIVNLSRDAQWYEKFPDLFTTVAQMEEHNFQHFTNPGDIQLYDIMCFQYPTRQYPHHLGIYLNNDLFLHHPREKLSTIEVYDSHWKKMTKILYRHRQYATTDTN